MASILFASSVKRFFFPAGSSARLCSRVTDEVQSRGGARKKNPVGKIYIIAPETI